MQIPRLLKPFYDVWMAFSHALGLVMSKMLLTILWIVLFGPYAIIWKIANRKKIVSKQTYWIEVESQSDLLRQF
jgi:hypothetical protein